MLPEPDELPPATFIPDPAAIDQGPGGEVEPPEPEAVFIAPLGTDQQDLGPPEAVDAAIEEIKDEIEEIIDENTGDDEGDEDDEDDEDDEGDEGDEGDELTDDDAPDGEDPDASGNADDDA